MAATDPKPIRILIADGETLLREALGSFLATQPGFTVVGLAGDTAQALALSKKLVPDVLLLDLTTIAGFEVLEFLTTESLSTRPLVLTASIGKPEMIRALQLGARGVVLKDCNGQLLFKAIRCVQNGEYWIARDSVSDLMGYMRSLADNRPDAVGPRFGLTRREMEIIAAVVAGCVNKDIAKKFAISGDTVKHHLTNIFNKLGVSNRLELALFALDRHLISKK